MPARSWWLGFLLVLGGRLWLVLPWVYLLFDPRREGTGPLLAIAAFFLGFGLAPSLIHLGLRLANTIPGELAKDDPRAPVVFLRPFGEDGKTREQHDLLGDESFGWIGNFIAARPEVWLLRRLVKGYLGELNRTLEQELKWGLQSYGPFVAIGRPGEKIQTIGAERIYMADDRWQEQVELLLKAAQIVIWQAGCSDSALWELSTLVRRVDPARVVLIVPSPLRRAASFDEVRGLLNAVLPRPLPLPAAREDVNLVMFSGDWEPSLHAYRYSSPNARLLEVSGFDVTASLLPVLSRLGGPVSAAVELPLSRRWKRALLDFTAWGSPPLAFLLVLAAQQLW